MKKFISISLVVMLILTSVASLIGYFGNFHWLFDLFVHFKLQYLIILLVGFPFLILLEKKKVFLLFFIPIATNLYDVSLLYFGGNRDESLKHALKICSANVLSSNSDFEKLKNLVAEEHPDIIILQEFTALCHMMMSNSLAGYHYRKEIPRADNFGIALYSKIPLEQIADISLGNALLPSIHCKVKTANGALHLITTHPLPPIGEMYTDSRNSQLRDLAKFTSTSNENFVVLGDLNTSSYSPHFKSLLEQGKLYDSRKGFGIQSSWPTWFPLASTTLDHCLATKNIRIKSRKIGRNIGSDHLPVIVEIGLKEP